MELQIARESSAVEAGDANQAKAGVVLQVEAIRLGTPGLKTNS